MKLLKKLEKIESVSSISERFYVIANFFLMFFGGTGVMGMIRYFDSYYKSKGYFFFFCSVLVVAFSMFAMLYLFKASKYKQAKESYYRLISEAKVEVNPLEDVFENKIIHLEQLRQPLNEPQKNKTLRNCRLVGPMTVYLHGGHFGECGFVRAGDVIALPNIERGIELAGVLVFDQCNLHKCIFIDVTILVSQVVGKTMQQQIPGCKVIGLLE